MNLQLVENTIIVLTCIHIIHIISIHPNTNSIHSNTNPSNSNTNSIHPIQTNSIQTNPIQSINIQHPNQISCGRSIHDTNNILTSSIDIFITPNIHSSIQFNSIQIPVHPTIPISK